LPTRLGQERPVAGVLVSYPNTDGAIHDYRSLVDHRGRGHRRRQGGDAATDLLALTLMHAARRAGAPTSRSGSSQRFGVPMGFGGPARGRSWPRATRYAASSRGESSACRATRKGKPAYRMSIQTREQHIRREKRATSNICTAQVLLAVMAAMYAVVSRPRRAPKQIATRVRGFTRRCIAGGLKPAWGTPAYAPARSSTPPCASISAPIARPRWWRHRRQGQRGLNCGDYGGRFDWPVVRRDHRRSTTCAALLEAFAGGRAS
jgi:glycine cleavage system pyridoxal-binding protein P